MSEQRHSIRLDGALSAVSGIHVAAFSSNRSRENMTEQMSKRIAVFNENESTGNIHSTRVPYVPANSIRGRIRRAITARAKQAMIDKGLTIPKAAYYLLTLGSASRAGAKGAYRVDDHAIVYNDPVLGIFGAETNYPSRLVTEDMIPITEETIEACAIPEDFHHFIAPVPPWKLLDEVTLTAKDDFTDQRDPYAPGVVSDYEKTYIETVQANAESSAKRKSGEDTKKIDMSNIMSFEIIMAGTQMYFSLAAHDLTPEQCGVLLAGVGDTLAHTHLGGNVRYGLGKVSGALQLSVDDGDRETGIVVEPDRAIYESPAQRFVEVGNDAIEAYDGEAVLAISERRTAA